MAATEERHEPGGPRQQRPAGGSAATRAGGRWLPYALVLPSAVLLVGLFGVPFLSLFSYALQQVGLDGTTTFVGMVNLTALINEQHFHDNVLLTLGYLLAVLALSVPIGYAAAVLVTRPLRGMSFVRGVLLTPWVLAPAVTAVLFRTIVDPAQGPVGVATEWLLGTPVEITSSTSGSIAVVVAHAVWRSFPLMMLLLAASMASIPPELYEAVRVDGGGRWREFRDVTLPLTRTSMVSACIMISVFSIHDAESIYALTGGGPGYATETMAVRLFKEAFLYYNVGGGAAIGLVLTALTLLILGALFWVSRRGERNLS